MNKKPYIIITLSAGLFLVAGLSLALNDETDSRNRTSVKNILEDKKRQEAGTDIRENKRETKADLKNKKQEVRVDIKETREEVKTRIKEANQAFKKGIEKKKEELKIRVEGKREELKTRIETKREDLKQRLEKVKDEKKKQAVERIDRQMDELNNRMLKHYVNVLDKLSEILVRISERADKAEERGVDVSAVRTAVDATNNAIILARSAIETQSSKTYTIQISTESAVRTDVGKARQALHNDLVIVRSAIKAAHDAVRNAATTLAKLPRPTPENTVSPTATPEPTQTNSQ